MSWYVCMIITDKNSYRRLLYKLVTFINNKNNIFISSTGFCLNLDSISYKIEDYLKTCCLNLKLATISYSIFYRKTDRLHITFLQKQNQQF